MELHSQLTTILLAVASCILVLTTVQLGLHIWKLRQQPMWPQGQLCPREVGGKLTLPLLLTKAPCRDPASPGGATTTY